MFGWLQALKRSQAVRGMLDASAGRWYAGASRCLFYLRIAGMQMSDFDNNDRKSRSARESGVQRYSSTTNRNNREVVALRGCVDGREEELNKSR